MQEDRTLRRNKMRSTEGPKAPPEARPLTHEHVVRGPRRDLSSAPALDAGSRHAPRARSSATRVASCNPARGAAALDAGSSARARARPLDARPRHAPRARSSATRVASCKLSAPMARGEATRERAVRVRAPYRARLGRRRVAP